jgi:hypothetical protein
MDAIISKIQQMEIDLATIKADLMKADMKQKVSAAPKSHEVFNKTDIKAFFAKPANAANAVAGAKVDMVAKEGSFKKKFAERFDSNTFVDDLYELAKDRLFKDGKTKKTVCNLPRTCWPLNEEGQEYEKLQHLCKDYDLSCIRDDPEKPTVFIVFDE